MQRAGEVRITAGDRVLVTGASGFIGSSLTRQLVARGADVVVLAEPGAPQDSLDDLPLERVVADLGDARAVHEAARAARVVIHLAARYRFWPPGRQPFYRVNVEGTRAVLDAAAEAGCERVVYTGTAATLGHAGRGAADETSYARLHQLVGAYDESKYVAEHEVLRAAAAGLPVVIVQPTAPVGPGDAAPTPTGRIVRDFLAGRMLGWVDVELSIADVDDVAAGHLLAAERGTPGRSYVLGGESLHFRQVLELLSQRTGLPAPRLRLPSGLLLAAAAVSETVEGRLLGREPGVPLVGVRKSLASHLFSDERARRELGYSTRPAAEALERAARWYVEHGHVPPRRVARIRWA
jgi:dihydroflavonol-4-reductase